MASSPTVVHEEIVCRQDEWERITDVLKGRDAVIGAGEKYVSSLGGQDSLQYRAMLKRGKWAGFTSRALDGIVGLVFSQEPTVNVPSVLTPLMDDVTLGDMTFAEFAKEVFTETAQFAWGGILVDVQMVEEQDDQDGEVPGDRPYMAHYTAGSVRYWRWQKVAGRYQATLVVLHELREVQDPDNAYAVVHEEQYRVLVLTPEQVYSQELWRKVADVNGQVKWQLADVVIPTRRGQPLPFIPFVFTPSKGVVPKVHKSAILDITDLNLDHWRLSVDIRHGGHFTALPTPCAAGFPEDMIMHLGPEGGWKTNMPGAEAWYLEFSGAGLSFVDEQMERVKAEIAVMGARMLETQKREVETAEAMTLRQAGEHSVVMALALATEKALERGLWYMGWWLGDEDADVSVTLTSTLMSLQMTTDDLSALWLAYQGGEISQQTWLEALSRKQLFRGRTWEEEAELVKAQGIRPGQKIQEEMAERAAERAVDRNAKFQAKAAAGKMPGGGKK